MPSPGGGGGDHMRASAHVCASPVPSGLLMTGLVASEKAASRAAEVPGIGQARLAR